MLRFALLFAVAFLSVFAALPQDDEGMSDEEFREFITNLIRQMIREEASKPPIIDPDCDAQVVERYLRLMRTLTVSVEFEGTTLDEAADFVRDVSGLNVYVSKDARQLAEGKTINLHLKDVRLKNLLVLMLKALDEELTFGIKCNVLYIGTKEELIKEQRLFIDIYFIGDILYQPPDYKAPDIALPAGDEELRR
ncbi:MAG: hypothetical protein DRP63_07040 [Planctomycetota bacterium]|nr:MAG: hypothetical protein DRP63_07040 [Planctomycetota bacterium]